MRNGAQSDPVCEHCGLSFRRAAPSRKRRFCSALCANVANRRDPIERFSRYVDATDSCWIWTGTRNHKGYGQAWDGTRLVSAHRQAWKLAGGTIVPRLFVNHTCDNPACVRADDEGVYMVGAVAYPRRGHLWVGPAQANTADMMAKGRGIAPGAQKPNRAETHPSARLSNADVANIRGRFAAGERQSDLARAFNISRSHVNGIVHSLHRRHG